MSHISRRIVEVQLRWARHKVEDVEHEVWAAKQLGLGADVIRAHQEVLEAAKAVVHQYERELAELEKA